jgi:hypothetical protein
MFSHKLNLGRGSRWQSLITNQTTRAHINLVFAISPLMSVLSTPTHKQLEQKKRRRRENKELTQMTKSQRKSQNWVI